MEELTDYSRHKILTDNGFEDLIDCRASVYAQKKELDAELKTVNEEISGLMAMLDDKAVLCNGFKVTLAEGVKRTLKKDILLTLGVEVETLAAATIETPYTRLTVTEVK